MKGSFLRDAREEPFGPPKETFSEQFIKDYKEPFVKWK